MLLPQLTAIDNIHFSHKLASMSPEIFNKISSFDNLSGMLGDGFEELNLLTPEFYI
jgi:hypothetical protein